MLVTVLYRLEGSPAVAGTNGFTDVKEGRWYTDAVVWAAANKIVSGYGGGLFGPDDGVTREQLAAMLRNYAGYKKRDVSASADLSAYKDAGRISSWAEGAMKWAVAAGLIAGRSADTLAPGGGATRAEVAAMLMRFCESLAKTKNR
jgi:hypothetical protein